MTKEEELDLLKQCGAALTAVTGSMELGSALVMLFPNEQGTSRIHAISNLQPDKCQELLEMYVGNARGLNVAPRRESVWLLMRCRQIDGVSVESVVSVHPNKKKAEVALIKVAEATDGDVAFTIEEEEVQLD